MPDEPPAQPWWHGVPSLEAVLACRGEEHVLRWADGALRLVDHPDLDGERALLALGADPCPCLALADAWAFVAERPGLAARLAGHLEGPDPGPRRDRVTVDVTAWLARRTRTLAVARRVVDTTPYRLRELVRLQEAELGHRALVRHLPTAFVAVLVGGAVAADPRQVPPPSVAALLLPLLRDLGVDAYPLVGHDTTPSAEGRQVRVPTAWLHRVWLRRAAVVDRQLALDLLVDDADPRLGTATVAAGAGVLAVRVRFDGRRWRAAG